jgi:branched-chain amino acid transport system permease protein
MDLFASALITGIGLGSMYGLLALGFYVTYAVSSTVNFAQGSTMMLGAVAGFTFGSTLGWPWLLAVIAALGVCVVWGMVVERIAVRPFAARGSDLWLMATVALGLILENVVLFTFGKDPRGMPQSFLTADAFSIGGLRMSILQVTIPVVGILIAVALHAFTRYSRTGKSMLAIVQNPDAARLMGIDVRRAVVGAYALSGLFAGIAGLLIAPLFTVSSSMGTLFGIKAFAVAILGGIGNPWGVMLAGLIYGSAESLITAGLGSTYTQILTFGLVIVALALRPDGLFGRAGVKKV